MLYLVWVFSPRAALHGFSGGGVRIHSSFVDAPSDRRIFIYFVKSGVIVGTNSAKRIVNGRSQVQTFTLRGV